MWKINVLVIIYIFMVAANYVDFCPRTVYSLMVHIMKTLILPPWLTSEKVTLNCKRTGPPLDRELFSKVRGSVAHKFPFLAF